MMRDVYVYPSIEGLHPRVMDALARLAPVQFRSCSDLSALRQGDVVLSLSGDHYVPAELAECKLRYFHVPRLTLGPRSENQGEYVRFAKSSNLDKRLSGRTISHWALRNVAAVSLDSGDEVLARYGERPVWVLRRTGDLTGHIASAPLPQLAHGEQPFDYLNGYHFMQLLPLLHFLREVTATLGWAQPPLRAWFMFDDPNLHWPSYGFLSYRELIQQARKDQFHVAIATVPLDAWGLHSRAISLFKESTEHLSLLVHGNNHTRDEFGQMRTCDGHSRSVAQALRRIERLERASGLHVDRVMVPPYEALVDSALAAMLRLGMEGVCIAPWSLRHWNPQLRRRSTFGLEMAEMTESGFPVLGRYRLSEACEGPSVISAFLGRPIVLAEHHIAARDGVELLAVAAKVVNSLGEVRWCGTAEMLRSNYLLRSEDSTLWVKPYSRRIEFRVPEGVSSVGSVGIEEADAGANELCLIRRPPNAEAITTRVKPDILAHVKPGDIIELISPNLGTVNYRQLETPGLSVSALSRRLLCEGRDRLIALMRANPDRQASHVLPK